MYSQGQFLFEGTLPSLPLECLLGVRDEDGHGQGNDGGENGRPSDGGDSNG